MSNILLDEKGGLHITRNGAMKVQFCPYTTAQGNDVADRWCGDWCPLFHEPETGGEYKVVRIELCSGELVCKSSEFVDHRPKGGEA